MSGENAVEIEPSALAAEADAIDIPAPAPPPGAEPAPIEAVKGGELTFEQAEALAASYEAAAYVLYDQAADIVAPNWSVTRAEKRQLAHATAVALALWFPDQQLPPKYVALLTLAGTVYSIADARRDPETGEIRPMRAARKSPPNHGEPIAGTSGAPVTTGAPFATGL